MTGRKNDLLTFHARAEGVARAKSELPPDGAWESEVSLAGNVSLHGLLGMEPACCRGKWSLRNVHP